MSLLGYVMRHFALLVLVVQVKSGRIKLDGKLKYLRNFLPSGTLENPLKMAVHINKYQLLTIFKANVLKNMIFATIGAKYAHV